MLLTTGVGGELNSEQLNKAYDSYQRGTGLSILAVRYGVDAARLEREFQALEHRALAEWQEEARTGRTASGQPRAPVSGLSRTGFTLLPRIGEPVGFVGRRTAVAIYSFGTVLGCIAAVALWIAAVGNGSLILGALAVLSTIGLFASAVRLRQAVKLRRSPFFPFAVDDDLVEAGETLSEHVFAAWAAADNLTELQDSLSEALWRVSIRLGRGNVKRRRDAVVPKIHERIAAGSHDEEVLAIAPTGFTTRRFQFPRQGWCVITDRRLVIFRGRRALANPVGDVRIDRPLDWAVVSSWSKHTRTPFATWTLETRFLDGTRMRFSFSRHPEYRDDILEICGAIAGCSGRKLDGHAASLDGTSVRPHSMAWTATATLVGLELSGGAPERVQAILRDSRLESGGAKVGPLAVFRPGAGGFSNSEAVTGIVAFPPCDPTTGQAELSLAVPGALNLRLSWKAPEDGTRAAGARVPSLRRGWGPIAAQGALGVFGGALIGLAVFGALDDETQQAGAPPALYQPGFPTTPPGAGPPTTTTTITRASAAQAAEDEVFFQADLFTSSSSCQAEGGGSARSAPVWRCRVRGSRGISGAENCSVDATVEAADPSPVVSILTPARCK